MGYAEHATIGSMTLPPELYRTIEQSVPIVCVDFILVRRDLREHIAQVGLIRRRSPFGDVWCHLGGRVRYGETVRSAILRHLTESLAAVPLDLPPDPQPDYVYQWFPEALAPRDGAPFGRDPRKHSVALSFVLTISGTPEVVPGGEAIEFGFWPRASLPSDLWPGCRHLLDRLLADDCTSS